jgi:hypothetical protein
MRRIERMAESVFGIENSTVDPNRFYSILLDARAASVSENMCDIAEKLLQGEKDNAKAALDQLWRLKKNLFSGKNETIDMLIAYYQEKVDILREREEYLKKVSLDSRNLLEEKRKRDEEVATVKQQVSDCTTELNELSEKLDKLKIKEQELTLIEHQLREELNRNENEIVNGLYEIILAQQEQPAESHEAPVQPPLVTAVGDTPDISASVEAETHPEENASEPEEEQEPDLPSQPDTKTITAVFEPPAFLTQGAGEADGNEQISGAELAHTVIPEPPQFPKSIVKTGKGRVIGEYFYDGKVYKNERSYIFNTVFFAEELVRYTGLLRRRFDLSTYTEMLQMIQDAQKRLTENKQLHFEVATNEILNEKSIKRLWQDAKLRSIDEVERFGTRLQAKIEALGTNYFTMLKEQMARCGEKS